MQNKWRSCIQLTLEAEKGMQVGYLEMMRLLCDQFVKSEERMIGRLVMRYAR